MNLRALRSACGRRPAVARQPRSLATKILELAADGPVSVESVARETGCKRTSASSGLSELKARGRLRRVDNNPCGPASYELAEVETALTPEAAAVHAVRGNGLKRGFATVNAGHARVAMGSKQSAAELKAERDAWLACKPKLPDAPRPAYNERGGR